MGARTKNNWTKSIGPKLTRTKSSWTKSIVHQDKKYFMFLFEQIGTYGSTNIKNTFYINIYNFLHIYQLSNLTQSYSMPYSLEEVLVLQLQLTVASHVLPLITLNYI